MSSFRPYAALHAAALLVGLALASFLPPAGAVRLGAQCGAGLAAFTGVVILAAGTRALTGSLQLALAAVVGAFLFRMLVVGVGLLAVHAFGGDLVAAAGAFFALYLVGQILELTYLSAQLKPAAQPGEPRA